MFFNSLQFAYFLPIVFLLYWFMPNKSKTSQNYILIIASYYFYSCWDWRFLFLLLFSTNVYAAQTQIAQVAFHGAHFNIRPGFHGAFNFTHIAAQEI